MLGNNAYLIDYLKSVVEEDIPLLPRKFKLAIKHRKEVYDD